MSYGKAYSKLLGFAPDAPPNTPGVMSDCAFLIPTRRGMRFTPSLVQADGTAISAPSMSVWPDATVTGALCAEVGNTIVVLAGSNASDGTGKLWRLGYYTGLTATSGYKNWEDVTDITALPSLGYTLAEWDMERFGDYIICARGNARYQVASTLRAYSILTYTTSKITAAPAACSIVTVEGFVLAFNIAGYASDGWHCCNRYDHTDWALLVNGSQSVRGRLIDTDGPIMGAIRFGNDVLAMKQYSIYRGRYTEDEEVFQWELMSAQAGAVGPLAMTHDPAGRVYWLGIDNFYVYDGAQIVGLMDDKLREWYVNQVSSTAIGTIQFSCCYDTARNLIAIKIPTSLTNGHALAFDPAKGIWTVAWRGVRTDVLFEFVANIYNNALSVGTAPGDRVLATFGTGNKMRALGLTYDGSSWPEPASFTLNEFGSDSVDTELRAARLRFIIAPSAGSTATGHHRANLDGSSTASGVYARTSDGDYEVHQLDRWHSLDWTLRSDCEFDGYALDIEPVGER